MAKVPTITVTRTNDPASFDVLYTAYEGTKELFSFKGKMFQDIKFDDWGDKFGPRHDNYVVDIMQEMFTNDKPDKADQIAQAFTILRESRKKTK